MTIPRVPFLKMHGLGNDFVVFDARGGALALGAEQARAVADRHTGVGCDQLVVVESARRGDADVFMAIRNADGGEVSACGNATRCVGAMIMAESGRDHVVIETRAGLLDVRRGDGEMIAVDMGPARLDWREIPLRAEVDTVRLPLALGPLAEPVAVSMGNPHAVFFVADAESVDLPSLGPRLEHDEWFPERANIEVVQVLDSRRLRMRVWERGAGITRACGTGACAAVVAAARRGLAGRSAEVVLDGGTLAIEWRDDGRVTMTGPAQVSFAGTLDPSLWR